MSDTVSAQLAVSIIAPGNTISVLIDTKNLLDKSFVVEIRESMKFLQKAHGEG